MSRPEAILIAGPTASGKSALAMRLARRLGGRIINADSMQVYRDLRILTARPNSDEMDAVPHALYGSIDGAQNHSVTLWLADAATALAVARDADAMPIFVGGTGLYLKALTQGLSGIPAIPPAVRTAMRTWAEGLAPEALHAELARRDPATAARLRATDPQRLLRALEVHEATGESLSRFHARRDPPLLRVGAWHAISLVIDRPTLRARVDRRLDAMVSQGVLDEVVRLEQRALAPALPVMRAIGVPQFVAHVRGALPLPAALDAAKTASRQYVKRQETFLRHQLPGFHPLDPEEAEAALMRACQSS